MQAKLAAVAVAAAEQAKLAAVVAAVVGQAKPVVAD